jgi:dolichyl-phosphate beta-glucosyltransferase
MIVSIIIPAYNEELRIEHTLKKVFANDFLSSLDLEIIVVDDASSDQTALIVKNIAQAYPCVKLLQGDINRGKGFSVRKGMLKARGDYLVFIDADNSTPIEEIQKLLPLVMKGDCDIAIGSRGLKESKIKVRQAWVRRNMGKTFNLFVRCLLLKDFPDTQCGFKCFSKKAAQAVFSLQRIDRFAFDVEALVIARIKGLTIKEVPVVWINNPQSKVNPINDASRMFFDLFLIKMNVWKGLYQGS